MNKSNFILPIAFFSVNAAFGWSLAINNQTPYEAHVWVRYEPYFSSCLYDYRIMQPGNIIHLNVGACLVQSIEAVLVTVSGDTSKNLPVKGLWKPAHKAASYRDFSVAIADLGTIDEKGRKEYGIKATFF